MCLGASENILTCLTSRLAVLQVVFFFLYFSISAACKQCQSLICKSLHCQRSTCSADMLKKKKNHKETQSRELNLACRLYFIPLKLGQCKANKLQPCGFYCGSCCAGFDLGQSMKLLDLTHQHSPSCILIRSIQVVLLRLVGSPT